MKKKLAVVALVVLVAALSVLGTAAYFTGKDTVENTSTNGKVAVCLGILIMLGVSLWNMPKKAAVSASVEAAK